MPNPPISNVALLNFCGDLIDTFVFSTFATPKPNIVVFSSTGLSFPASSSTIIVILSAIVIPKTSIFSKTKPTSVPASYS